MFDHVSITVQDLEKAKAFYLEIFAPLGFKIWVNESDYAGFGTQARPHFWLNKGAAKNQVHIAFSATDRNAVDAFFEAALRAGGRDNGKPGLRPAYHKDYYGAFIFDLDGNNIEAVCHKPQ